MRSILLLLFIITIVSCQENTVNISIDSKNDRGTLVIKEVITDMTINKIEISDTSYTVDLDSKKPILTSVASNYSEGTALSIFSQGDTKNISINKDSINISGSLQDSLANYIWRSTNAMFTRANHGDEIFGNSNPDRVKELFDSLVNKRNEIIVKYKDELNSEIIALLKHQNKSRAYSFLLYYGRMMNDIDPKSDYYNFIDLIDNENYYSIYSPSNVLYKYEIEYLRSGRDIKYNTFNEYIDNNTEDPELTELYKAFYLKELIESPDYWRNHETLFEGDVLVDHLNNFNNSSYSYLLKDLKYSIKTSEKGKEGFDFTAITSEGEKVKLSDFKGKYVLIDTWATWCGPCVKHRPDLIKIASETLNNNIQYLMVSVDKNTDKWESYINKQNLPDNSLDVRIPNHKINYFRKQFFIPSIPRYILIDPDGRIVDSDLISPSNGLKEYLLKVIS
ncbi:TlpA family protein disulfide reductase [Mangrovivirga cuniculi]|uniref:Thioredoxin domain-containing protein n=1 Tax=Mangrovivirga cuniculi TaxID=2715131 RepID=A0A4D7JT84_9BACT|nr:TlpA disulfide reductase family protein [Mangrovivirga cuniculi]QCK16720.1 hypothetical protein DCC35_19265 [Mangrovivirga cuniculi]